MRSHFDTHVHRHRPRHTQKGIYGVKSFCFSVSLWFLALSFSLTHTHTRTYTHMYKHARKHAHTCTHTHTNTHTPIHTHTHVHAGYDRVLFVRVCMCMRVWFLREGGGCLIAPAIVESLRKSFVENFEKEFMVRRRRGRARFVVPKSAREQFVKRVSGSYKRKGRGH